MNELSHVLMVVIISGQISRFLWFPFDDFRLAFAYNSAKQTEVGNDVQNEIYSNYPG